MKSGLYACAGASATASAAAWAKRFDEPMTKESNVYFVLKPPLSGRFCGAGSARSRGPTTSGSPSRSSSRSAGSSAVASATRSSTGRSWPVTSRMAAPIRPRKCPSIQSRVKSFGTARMKRVVVELEAVCLPEPGAVGGVVECPSEPTGDFAPQALRSQLDLVLHPASGPLLTSMNDPSGEHTNLRKHCKCGQFCRHFPHPQIPSTAVESGGGNSPFRPGSAA